MLEEDPQRDMLRVHAPVSIVGMCIGSDHDPQPSSLRQQQTEPLRRAKLGDPVQVGDEAFGTVFLRSGEERLERIAGGVGIAAQRVQVEGPEQVAVALEEPHHQLGVDRSGELGADEFPQVVRHQASLDSGLFLIRSIRMDATQGRAKIVMR